VETLERVGGGGNSRIYRIEGPRGRFALKVYPAAGTDPRDRLDVEFKSLRFLEANGISGVPRALAVDRERSLLLLDWIDGERIDAPRDGDIESALAFLRRIGHLRDAEGAQQLPLASEACLSGEELMRQLRMRAEPLLALDDARLLAYLREDWLPKLDAFEARARDGYARSGLDFMRDLEPGRRSLIPADFGFHNGLRRSDGSVAFVDFEYFGWDDPVKLMADFVLHPAMVLEPDMKRGFIAGMTEIFARDNVFRVRFDLLYGLFGLRWCMILLNEFLSERWARRSFAGSMDWAQTKSRQLGRARRLLDRLPDGGVCGMGEFRR